MEELKHPVYNELCPNVVFNFVSVFKVSKINVKYVTCASAKRDDQNSAKLRVCFIRVYVFAFAATFNTVFCFFLANQTSFNDELTSSCFVVFLNRKKINVDSKPKQMKICTRTTRESVIFLYFHRVLVFHQNKFNFR
jgi:hypothetical protein